MVDNHYEIFRYFDREDEMTEVDSEAIFASVYHMGDADGLRMIEGTASVCYSRLSDPDTLVLARTYSQPLCVATTVNGSFVFASELSVIAESGLEIQDIYRVVDTGVYSYVTRGQQSEWQIFDNMLYAGSFYSFYDQMYGHQADDDPLGLYWPGTSIHNQPLSQDEIASNDIVDRIDARLDELYAQQEAGHPINHEQLEALLDQAYSVSPGSDDQDSTLPGDL